MAALDVLPSCSAHNSNLLDQLSARLAAISILSGSGGPPQSVAALFASSPPSGITSTGQQMPSSPPPMGARAAALNHNFNRRKFDANSNEFCTVQNAVAMAVLVRLHRWCCQLFWLTIVCLISYCSDQQQQQQQQQRRNGGKHDDGTAAFSGGTGGSTTATDQQQKHDQYGRRAFREVRKSIVHATQRRGTKTVTELEMQLLRHLTCPQTAVLRPLRPSQHKKRHFLSRPPSPQLFDISEENEQ